MMRSSVRISSSKTGQLGQESPGAALPDFPADDASASLCGKYPGCSVRSIFQNFPRTMSGIFPSDNIPALSPDSVRPRFPCGRRLRGNRDRRLREDHRDLEAVERAAGHGQRKAEAGGYGFPVCMAEIRRKAGREK